MLLCTGLFYSKARHYLFSASVVYWIAFLLLTLQQKTHWNSLSSFIAKWKICLKQWTDTLLKVYLRDAQINSFDLRRSGWRWVGERGEKKCEQYKRKKKKTRQKLYLAHVNISIMYCETTQFSLQPVENVHENKAIRSVSCNEQYITASRKTGNMT